MNADWSRRRFVVSGGALSSATWLKLSSPALAAAAMTACDARAAFSSLTDAQAKELSAISARLIPTTDTPGATEAGVIHFIDQSLAGDLSDEREALLAGLAQFLADLDESHPNHTFSALEEIEQDAFLTAQEGSEFFEFMRLMTIYGFFAMSSYGGNRDHLGWSLIGFEGHGAWTTPFGYYDTEASR